MKKEWEEGDKRGRESRQRRKSKKTGGGRTRLGLRREVKNEKWREGSEPRVIGPSGLNFDYKKSHFGDLWCSEKCIYRPFFMIVDIFGQCVTHDER